MCSPFVDAILETVVSISEVLSGVDCSIYTALIGVAGTLLGTILGWLLNSFSQKGKLNIFVTSWEDNFQYNNHGSIEPCETASQAAYYSCDLSLDVYNSSAETRIMRNMQLVFAKGKNEIMVHVPDDNRTERYGAGCARYDKIGPVNIPPKSVATVRLRFGEWDENGSIKNYWEVNRISLRYTDKKNRVKQIPISSKNYADYFSNDKEASGDEKK